jgi:hypothetical protein
MGRYTSSRDQGSPFKILCPGERWYAIVLYTDILIWMAYVNKSNWFRHLLWWFRANLRKLLTNWGNRHINQLRLPEPGNNTMKASSAARSPIADMKSRNCLYAQRLSEERINRNSFKVDSQSRTNARRRISENLFILRGSEESLRTTRKCELPPNNKNKMTVW